MAWNGVLPCLMLVFWRWICLCVETEKSWFDLWLEILCMWCKIPSFLTKMTCHMTSHKGSIRKSRIFVFAVSVLLQLTSSLVSGQTDEAMPWSFRSMERLGSGSVDAFIEAQLTKQNLKPNAKADPYTLIRRATFDLTGLPPLPNEVLSFVNDPLPDAYDRLIDRLLASPWWRQQTINQSIIGIRQRIIYKWQNFIGQGR